MTAESPEPPLCVDLDGTLIDGDTLVLSVRYLARHTPWHLLALPFVLLRGRPALKAWIAARYVPDPTALAWREDVLEFLHSEKARGRRLVLTTAAHHRVAQRIAEHLGLFDALVATDESTNAKGAEKVVLIRKSLQCKEFDYIGDSQSDLPIFEAARTSYLVAPSRSLGESAAAVGRIARVFRGSSRPRGS